MTSELVSFQKRNKMNRFLKGLSYTFHRNIGIIDRIVRVIVALALIIAWYFNVIVGLIGTVLAILSIMLIGTAAIAKCGVTYWFDANTMTKVEKQNLDNKGIKYE